MTREPVSIDLPAGDKRKKEYKVSLFDIATNCGAPVSIDLPAGDKRKKGYSISLYPTTFPSIENLSRVTLGVSDKRKNAFDIELMPMICGPTRVSGCDCFKGVVEGYASFSEYSYSLTRTWDSSSVTYVYKNQRYVDLDNGTENSRRLDDTFNVDRTEKWLEFPYITATVEQADSNWYGTPWWLPRSNINSPMFTGFHYRKARTYSWPFVMRDMKAIQDMWDPESNLPITQSTDSWGRKLLQRASVVDPNDQSRTPSPIGWDESNYYFGDVNANKSGHGRLFARTYSNNVLADSYTSSFSDYYNWGEFPSGHLHTGNEGQPGYRNITVDGELWGGELFNLQCPYYSKAKLLIGGEEATHERNFMFLNREDSMSYNRLNLDWYYPELSGKELGHIKRVATTFDNPSATYVNSKISDTGVVGTKATSDNWFFVLLLGNHYKGPYYFKDRDSPEQIYPFSYEGETGRDYNAWDQWDLSSSEPYEEHYLGTGWGLYLYNNESNRSASTGWFGNLAGPFALSNHLDEYFEYNSENDAHYLKARDFSSESDSDMAELQEIVDAFNKAPSSCSFTQITEDGPIAPMIHHPPYESAGGRETMEGIEIPWADSYIMNKPFTFNPSPNECKKLPKNPAAQYPVLYVILCDSEGISYNHGDFFVTLHWDFEKEVWVSGALNDSLTETKPIYTPNYSDLENGWVDSVSGAWDFIKIKEVKTADDYSYTLTFKKGSQAKAPLAKPGRLKANGDYPMWLKENGEDAAFLFGFGSVDPLALAIPRIRHGWDVLEETPCKLFEKPGMDDVFAGTPPARTLTKESDVLGSYKVTDISPTIFKVTAESPEAPPGILPSVKTFKSQ